MSGIAERLAEVLHRAIWDMADGEHWPILGDDWPAAEVLAQALLPVVEREIAAARGEVVARVGALAVEWERSGFDMEAGQLRAALSSDPDCGEGEGRTCACGSLLLSTTASERHDRGLHGPAHCIGTQARVWGQS